jgi:HD superfamily phosphodiesterase
MTGYFKLRRIVLEQLKNSLPTNLTYHDVDHVLDVLEVCNQYIKRNKIKGSDAYLLRIGALVHDLGFTISTQNHEEVGAEMAQEIMEKLNMDPNDIEIVKGLVMATKIPQSPKTELQKIICDSDLDYLGRNNYVEISDKLYQELKSTDVLKNREEWVELQIKFLKSHSFHTEFAKKNREPKKQYWLQYIIKNENY